MAFSKHLMGLSLQELGQHLRAIGLTSIDLTVRPGGHVEPERVEDDLPRTAEILAAQGVSIGMITTAITRADENCSTRVLRTAATLGIGYYKLGYYYYDGFGTLRAQREEAVAQLRDLAALNQEVGIHGGFHNHSADSLGALPGDIDYVLRNVSPEAIGWYCDPMHACIEGGSAGWMMALDLLQERLTMLAVKDFHWLNSKHGYAGARRHSVLMCPLLEGNTPWQQVLALLHRINFQGPVSFHGEYSDVATFTSPMPQQVLQLLEKDLEVFERWRQQVLTEEQQSEL
jgi:sugar phosphate isomerase/epimerase